VAQGARDVRRTFKFQLRPTARQAAALAGCLEDHRQLYNAALQPPTAGIGHRLGAG
jgi:transposase